MAAAATSMSTAKRAVGGRHTRRNLIAGLALVAALAIIWLVFGSGVLNEPSWWKNPLAALRHALSEDDASRVISERWLEIYYDRDSPDTGPDGDVAIVAFLDYDSADCRAVAEALGRLHDADRGVRIVFKELATPGSGSEFAARAALAADRQDRFISLHKELTHRPSQLTESSVIMAARLAGLDIERLRADMNDPAITKALEENQTLAWALGITSSPAFIVGDRILRGAVDLRALEAAVAKARTRPSM